MTLVVLIDISGGASGQDDLPRQGAAAVTSLHAGGMWKGSMTTRLGQAANLQFHRYILQEERDGCLAQWHFKLGIDEQLIGRYLRCLLAASGPLYFAQGTVISHNSSPSLTKRSEGSRSSRTSLQCPLPGAQEVQIDRCGTYTLACFVVSARHCKI